MPGLLHADRATRAAGRDSFLTAVWHMLTDDVAYQDLDGDYYAKYDPEQAMRRITRQAFTVRFDAIEAA